MSTNNVTFAVKTDKVVIGQKVQLVFNSTPTCTVQLSNIPTGFYDVRISSIEWYSATWNNVCELQSNQLIMKNGYSNFKFIPNNMSYYNASNVCQYTDCYLNGFINLTLTSTSNLPGSYIVIITLDVVQRQCD